MANTLKLEIVTPEAKIYSDDVDMVTLTGVEGEMGILPNHVPLMTQLCAGEIVAHKGQDTIFLAVGDGFVQVTGDRVAVLTDMAIRAENIDEARAEEARLRGRSAAGGKNHRRGSRAHSSRARSRRGPAQGQTPAAEINLRVNYSLVCRGERVERFPDWNGESRDILTSSSLLA